MRPQPVPRAIEERLRDARFLWESGRLESGLLLALVAVAARSRINFPDLKDREAFESTMRAALSMNLSAEFRGEMLAIERIFYKWLRCELVHAGGLPDDVKIDPELGNELTLRAGGAPEYLLKFSSGWFDLCERVARG